MILDLPPSSLAAKLAKTGVDITDAYALQFKNGGVANINVTVEVFLETAAASAAEWGSNM